jgi:adhesin HecA-like repeat protein
LEKSGVITTDGGQLQVTAGEIDNSFGILNAQKGVVLSSSGEVINESGLIRSGRKALINGKQLRNGYQKTSQVYDGVNPNHPIMEERVISGRWHMVAVERSERRFRNGLFRMFNHGYRTPSIEYERQNLPDIRDFVIAGYESMPQASTTSAFPGYIFPAGDMAINSELPAYLGTMVSEGDIMIRGQSMANASFRDRGTIIANGDVNVEMQRAATDQVAIQARNISIKVMEDFIISGVIRPTVLPDGTIVHMLDLRRLAHSIGMIVDDAHVMQQHGESEDDIPQDSGNNPLVAVRTADSCGFIGERPADGLFIPSLPDNLLRSILNLALTPVHGRETLVREDLVALLERMGQESSHGELTEGSVPSLSPAILYRPSEQGMWKWWSMGKASSFHSMTHICCLMPLAG